MKMEEKSVMIEAIDISKEYKLRVGFMEEVKRRLRRKKSTNDMKIPALANISLKVMKGESVAIIGKNGSGKSTLLQIICGTLAATNGKVNTNGRVAALLELGSGFNPEFTGRENIYINGILLGLSKNQVKERIDKIIDFAELGVYIDQPIKTYSSGMVVRIFRNCTCRRGYFNYR